jgi:hypothetical protein
MFARRHLLLAAAAALVCPGAVAAAYRPPHTRSGAPDLQGVWTNASGTELQRPAAFTTLVVSEAEARAYEARMATVIGTVPGDDVGQPETEGWEPPGPLARIRGEVRTSWIVDPPDGRLPYRPEARRAMGQRIGREMGNFDHPEARFTAERCLMAFGSAAAPPMLNTPMNNLYQIVQTADHVVIEAESNHSARVIPLKAQAPIPGPGWLGHSTGRWEGDVLVIETTRFHPDESLRSLPFQLYMSPDAHVTERLSRIGPGELLYGFEVDDPAVFTRKWRAEMLFTRARGRIFEDACHEGNYSMANVLAGARKVERDARGPAR